MLLLLPHLVPVTSGTVAVHLLLDRTTVLRGLVAADNDKLSADTRRQQRTEDARER